MVHELTPFKSTFFKQTKSNMYDSIYTRIKTQKTEININWF